MDGTVPHAITVVASHQDQVIAAPEGAIVMAESAFTPFAALLYAGGTALSMQFHPEFSHRFAAELVETRRAALPDGMPDRALASLEAAGDAALVGSWIRRFLGDAVPTDPNLKPGLVTTEEQAAGEPRLKPTE